jgi:glycosyltransferase involved in cell wall biosynthesis
MELIFLDAGLQNKAGHSYKLAKAVSQNLKRRNLPHRVFGLHSLEASIAAETGAIPHFSRSLYDGEDCSWWEKQRRTVRALLQSAPELGPDRSERRSFKKLNEDFERDLLTLPSDIWQPGNLLYIVAISQNQILGLMRFLRKLPETRLPRIVCNLMFPPSFVPWGTVSQYGKQYYGQAFDEAAPLTGRRLCFTVENEAMRAAYQRDFGIGTRILPIPFVGAHPKKTKAGPVRIGFFGDSKCDKGFHLLPEAIALCQENKLAAEFVIQIQHNHWEPRTIAAEGAIRALKNVQLVEGILSCEDYEFLTSQMDVMLLPYDPIAFGPARGSGIFTESVAAGRPVVAAQGTFAGDSVSGQEAEGEVFAPHTSAALAAAIARLLPRLPACKARAAKHAKEYARRHSPDAFTGALLELAKA